MAEIPAYPLHWPATWPRARHRETSRFHTNGQLVTLGDAIRRVTDQMRKLGVSSFIVSTDAPVRRDGLPYASASLPRDPGAALYFTRHKKPYALACDRYTRLPDNLAALAAHIDALRAIERYGVGTLEQAFAGYTALPPAGGSSKRAWWEVLGCSPYASQDDAKAAHRRLVKQYHPDLPTGSHAMMSEINAALDDALRGVSS